MKSLRHDIIKMIQEREAQPRFDANKVIDDIARVLAWAINQFEPGDRADVLSEVFGTAVKNIKDCPEIKFDLIDEKGRPIDFGEAKH